MRQIPSTGAIPIESRKVIDALKENIEEIRGARGNNIKIALLPGTATTNDIITKINELIKHLQG